MTDKPRIFSTAEAADYLGITVSTLKYHLYEKGHLRPDRVIGDNLVFYQETLDAYLRRHQTDGLTGVEAAAYLGVSPSTIRHHVAITGYLVPDGKRGRNHIFTRATLERLRPRLRSSVVKVPPPD